MYHELAVARQWPVRCCTVPLLQVRSLRESQPGLRWERRAGLEGCIIDELELDA